MDIEKLRQDIADNLNNLKHDLPDMGFEDISEYIQVGEYKLAMEVLCNIIFEYKVLISNTDYIRTLDLCKSLSIDDKYWMTLKDNIKN